MNVWGRRCDVTTRNLRMEEEEEDGEKEAPSLPLGHMCMWHM